jgi:hypothetical protein
LKGKARRDAVTAAMKLSDEQKEARQKFQKMQAEVRKQVIALLSPEQIKKAGIRVGRERGKKRKKDDG